MKLLGNLLSKYKDLTPPDDFKKEVISETIFRFAGFKVQKKDIELSGKMAYIKVSPAKKTELFLKKPLILKELAVILDKSAPKDIR